jgi:hypothetical protein
VTGVGVWHVVEIALFVSVCVQGLVLIGVMRQVGGISLQLTPVRVGDVDAGPAVGTQLALSAIPPGVPTLLVFVSPTCSVCEAVVSALPVVGRHYPDVEVVAAVIGGDEASRATYARRLGPMARLDLVATANDLAIPGTPFVIGVDGDGRVQTRGVANTLDHLESVLETLLSQSADPEADATGFHSNLGPSIQPDSRPGPPTEVGV